MSTNHAVASPPAGRTSPPQAMVGDQLDALLGEHLMPLRARTPGRDEPYLLAVDASGQPVVVEVVAVLDEEAVLRALRHAGRASRMSTRDLAEAYSGGADRFASHLAAFRLTVPATALLSTFVRGGARLLLVCSHVSPGVADVLEFLLQPGWQVDVLRARVVTEADGRRVVELSPVARPATPRRDFELPHWAKEPRPDPLFDPTPVFRSTPLPRFDDRRRAGTTQVRLAQASAAARPEPGRPEPTRSDPTRSQPMRPEPVRFGSVQHPPVRQAPSGAPTAVAPTRPAPAVVPPSFAVPVSTLEAQHTDPVLVALAEVLEGPAPLVWSPEPNGTRYEAMLRADGAIEFADGSRFGDVEAAARAISGDDGPLDAWQVWHVDSPTGPTLAELAEAVFPDQF